MDSEISVDNLSQALGFRVSKAFEETILAAQACSPKTPHKGLEKFGLELGGPLFAFVGGESAQSLRIPHMAPEFFPFAVRRSTPDVYVGFVVDEPDLDGEESTTFGVCVPEHPERTGVIARNEQELFRWLDAHRDCLDELGTTRSTGSYCPQEVRRWRERAVSYRTADQMGVVVPIENTPLALVHEEMRAFLIEQRELSRVREVGLEALRVEAPGAALALARDITWWLGHRPYWYQLANELYVGAYSLLRRPLLNRIVGREWVRLYGGSTRP